MDWKLFSLMTLKAFFSFSLISSIALDTTKTCLLILSLQPVFFPLSFSVETFRSFLYSQYSEIFVAVP